MSTDYMQIAPAPGRRIAYGPAPEHVGELRLPAGGGPHPVVVVIHGGWWRAQWDFTYAGHLAEALARDGYATWNVEHRRVGHAGGGYPGTLADVSAALAALRDLAPAHALDLARVVLTGHSAGGQLAAWLAAKATHRELDAFGPTLPVAGIVPVGAVLDLQRTSELRVGRDGEVPVHAFLGGTHDDVPERYALASPAALVPTGVPAIVVHGDADASVPVEVAERYVARARAAGDDVRFDLLPGVDHFAPFDPATPAGAHVRAAIRDLIERAG